MKYTPEIVDKICELVSSGDFTAKDICKQVDINTDTYHEWKNNKPEFTEALKKADERRLQSLMQIARSGIAKKLDIYKYDEIHTEKITTSKGVITKEKTIKKIIMPDTAMLIFYACNQDPDNFQNTQKVDHTTKGEKITGIQIINPNVAETETDTKAVPGA